MAYTDSTTERADVSQMTWANWGVGARATC